MEEEEGSGAGTPPFESRRHELLVTGVREGHTPAAPVSIHMNFKGSRENFLQPAPPLSDGGLQQVCISGIFQPAHAPKYYGPYICGCSRSSSAISGKHTSSRSCTRRQNAEVQSKGKHSDNAFRLDPNHCHHLSNPNVLIAYNKWATNQHWEEGSLLGVL